MVMGTDASGEALVRGRAGAVHTRRRRWRARSVGRGRGVAPSGFRQRARTCCTSVACGAESQQRPIFGKLVAVCDRDAVILGLMTWAHA